MTQTRVADRIRAAAQIGITDTWCDQGALILSEDDVSSDSPAGIPLASIQLPSLGTE